MTFYPTTLGINLPIDNAIRDQIISEMSISDIYNSDYVALCITNVSNWELDVNEFNFIKNKEFVIFDFSEYGHDIDVVEHIFGENSINYINRLNTKKFIDLDECLKKVKIKCYFKRELPKNLKLNTYYPIYPIEYLSLNYLEYKIDSLEEYNKRPIDIFFNWGWSNPSRAKLHGDFYSLADLLNYKVISNHLHLVNEKKENPNSIIVYANYTPHHSRFHINTILEFQKISKISISLNGSGVKCFRHSESSVNSLMALQYNSLKWTYEWDDSNSIVLPNFLNTNKIDSISSINKLMNLLREGNLYDRYVKCIETNKLYNQKKYTNELLSSI